ncbi:tRNA modification GTPase MnmE [Poriferisphaera corsica]|uniref:tRNA modification GTPase MnmE n=1 Tax=Poriferisphaera corsica TaxID=2528020 RepID=A0A517YQC3_9BACT|nr:GTPase [Poriferisphaera corsica]QDU32424.1 tRNA modification GTPase MnmE [Poriferisphaera corsica]
MQRKGHEVVFTVTTPAQPGAVAILQLSGRRDEVLPLLKRLTGRERYEDRRVYLTDYAGIDHGLTAVLPVQRIDHQVTAQLMPHGGLRVVQKMTDYLVSLGAIYEEQMDTMLMYPEANSRLEADVLAAIASAASPAAIGLLASQTQRWYEVIENQEVVDWGAVERDSERLNQLLKAPKVAVVGRPNVGKSALLNYLTGQNTAIVADLPGTTRDWVGAFVELAISDSALNDEVQLSNNVAVRWHDTPGLRTSNDEIEQEAIKLAKRVLDDADVLIAMRDTEQGFAELKGLDCVPDLYVMNKVDNKQIAEDQKSGCDKSTVMVSAMTGYGLDTLQKQIIEVLGLNLLLDKTSEMPLWAFCETLRIAVARRNVDSLEGYV